MKIKRLAMFLVSLFLFVGCGNGATIQNNSEDNNTVETSQSEDEDNGVDSLIENCTSITMTDSDEGTYYQISLDADKATFTYHIWTSNGYEERNSEFLTEKFEDLRDIIISNNPSLLTEKYNADENGKILGTISPMIEIYSGNHTYPLELQDISQIKILFENLKNASDITYQDGDVSVDTINIDSLVDYPVNGGSAFTISLKDDGSGEVHYAVISVSLSLNSEHADYEKYSPDGMLKSYDNVLSDTVKTVIAGYTIDEIRNNEEAAKEDILNAVQSLFKSTFIVKVNFPSTTYQ